MPENPSAVWRDPVIEVYKRDVDRTLLRESLKRTPAERLGALQKLVEFAEELGRAMIAATTQR